MVDVVGCWLILSLTFLDDEIPGDGFPIDEILNDEIACDEILISRTTRSRTLRFIHNEIPGRCPQFLLRHDMLDEWTGDDITERTTTDEILELIYSLINQNVDVVVSNTQ